MWKLNDKQMFNHSLDSAGGPFHPSTFKSIHDIKHYQTISSTFDYIKRSIGKAICQKIATPGKGITATDEAPTLVGHGKSWQVSRDKCASIIEGLRESFPWGFADN